MTASADNLKELRKTKSDCVDGPCLHISNVQNQLEIERSVRAALDVEQSRKIVETAAAVKRIEDSLPALASLDKQNSVIRTSAAAASWAKISPILLGLAMAVFELFKKYLETK